jgi:hypothetical protein
MITSLATGSLRRSIPLVSDELGRTDSFGLARRKSQAREE